MTEEVEGEEEAPKKASKMPLIIGLVLALVGGGGGFFAVSSGMILAPPEVEVAETETEELKAIPDIAYVPVDPLIISLHKENETAHLKFRAQLEVPSAYKSDVELVLPRVVDVMNSYLRALRIADVEAPDSLVRLRAQMLRRVQVVTGKSRVNDLLVMEFVVN